MTLSSYSEYAATSVIQKGCTVAETRQPGIKLCCALSPPLPYEQVWERQSKRRGGGSFLVFFASGLKTNAPNRSGRTPVLRNLISYNLIPTLLRPGCRSRLRWPRSKANAAGKSGIRVCLLGDLTSRDLCIDDPDTAVRMENPLPLSSVSSLFEIIALPRETDSCACAKARTLWSHPLEKAFNPLFWRGRRRMRRGWRGVVRGVFDFGTKAR